MGRAPGDDDFEAAFDALFASARRIAVRLVGDGAEADDVAAEALARAYARWSKVADLDHRDAWVMRCAASPAASETSWCCATWPTSARPTSPSHWESRPARSSSTRIEPSTHCVAPSDRASSPDRSRRERRQHEHRTRRSLAQPRRAHRAREVGSSSSPQHPAVTAAPHAGDFRIALVAAVQAGAAHLGDPCLPSVGGESCYVLGRTLVTARDVRDATVRHDASAGWIVEVTFTRNLGNRFATAAGHQAAIVVNGRVQMAPVINPGIAETVTISRDGLTRAQAIALATEIGGRAPADIANPAHLTTTIELPGTEFAAGTQVHGTLVVENATDQPITLEAPGQCHGKWAVVLTSPTVPSDAAWTLECATLRTVIPPGVNRYPFTMSTWYGSCVGAGGSAPSSTPRCTAGGIPPLPAGEYHAVLVTSTPGLLPNAPEVPVRIVAP